jgi:hypothetical protein
MFQAELKEMAMQTQAISAGMINRWQVKMLHVLKSKLKLTEEQYRERIEEMSVFGTSCKDLTFEEADELIYQWKAEAIEKGVWQESRRRPGGYKKKYEHLGKRAGMGTPAQLRMIEGMWADVSRYNNAPQREKALRAFLFKRYHVSDIVFLTSSDVNKVVKALEAMKKDIQDSKFNVQNEGATAELPVQEEDQMAKTKYSFCSIKRRMCDQAALKSKSEKCRACSDNPASATAEETAKERRN